MLPAGKSSIIVFDAIDKQIFVVVFVIEAILKLTALGPAQYFKDEWNTFDFIVTALGVIELSVEGVQGLSVLRAFRLVSGFSFQYCVLYTNNVEFLPNSNFLHEQKLSIYGEFQCIDRLSVVSFFSLFLSLHLVSFM